LISIKTEPSSKGWFFYACFISIPNKALNQAPIETVKYPTPSLPLGIFNALMAFNKALLRAKKDFALSEEQ